MEAVFEVPWRLGRPDLAIDEDDQMTGLVGYSVAPGQNVTAQTTSAVVVVYATAERLAVMDACGKFSRVEQG